MAGKGGTTRQEVVGAALGLPGTVRAVSWGEPSLKVGHLLTRLRAADASLVPHDVPPGERDTLVAADPVAFFLEPPQAPCPIVLARPAAIGAARVAAFLERRRRAIAPPRAVAARDT